MSYVLKIRKAEISCASLAEASAIYSKRRDASGQGMSRWPEGEILENGVTIGRVSYNGRIWPGPWEPDMVPLYDNREAKP